MKKAQMFGATLLVERRNHRVPFEDWGKLVFLSSPSPSDRVAVMRAREQQFFTVLGVHPRLVAAGAAKDSDSGPSAEAVARWPGVDSVPYEN